jgi:hypothetical protein
MRTVMDNTDAREGGIARRSLNTFSIRRQTT